VEVLAEMTKKVKDLDDENDRCMARIKDLEIKCLEKENVIYSAREKFFMYALLLSWFAMLLVACVALIK